MTLASYFSHLLQPSAHYRALAETLSSMSGLGEAVSGAGSEALDTLEIDVDFQSDDPDAQVQVEILPSSRTKADRIVESIGQQVAGDLSVLKNDAERCFIEDLERILVPLDANGRELAQDAGVVEDWLDIARGLGALEHLVRWSRSQSADWVAWFLDNAHSIDLADEAVQTAIIRPLSDGRAHEYPEHMTHWVRWLLAGQGVANSVLLQSIAVGGWLRAEDDPVAEMLVAEGVEADALNADWMIVGMRAKGRWGASGSEGWPLNSEQIYSVLDLCLDRALERWPELAQAPTQAPEVPGRKRPPHPTPISLHNLIDRLPDNQAQGMLAQLDQKALDLGTAQPTTATRSRGPRL